ncbi:secretogranin-2b-like [Anguilla rostrata]|uniref:secretogranin-2b-like n=1 Tax=Anguilla rostrata TaxID=7938 RepID=UPI0030CC98B6
MLSLHQLSLAGAALLFATVLHARGALSATLRQHRLRSGEAEGRALSPIFTPNYDMVKALEYIESLRQQTGREEELARDYDDADRPPPYLSRLAQLQSQSQSQSPERGDTAAAAADWQDHKTQQWLKALLRNLQKQAGGGGEPAEAPAASGARHAQRGRQRGEQEDGGRPAPSEIVDYGGNPKPHKKYPLMFEEDEASQEGPYKRANERAEEQYTPQGLATLQSVFQELGKLSAAKNQKRQNPDEEQRLYRGGDEDEDEDEDDLYRLRSLAYEDVAGGEDWSPLEENVETEEVVKDSQEMFNRGLDDDDVDDGGDGDLKRSAPPMYGDKDDQDDINRLVDYYLLKILEKTERTEEKRDRGQERRAEKRPQRPSYGVDPAAFYQLMEISRKLQIPPEDLVEMVSNGEIKKLDATPDAREAEPETEDDLDLDEGAVFYGKDGGPASKFHGRRVPDGLANDVPDDLDAEDILNILGLESSSDRNAKYFLRQGQPKGAPSRYPSAASAGRRGDYFPSKPRASDKRADDYYGAVDEDELATFLAAKMLAQYPEVASKGEQRRASPLAYGIPEQAIKDYIDRMDGEKTSAVKRQAETDEEAAAGDSTQTQQLDDVALPDTATLEKPEAERKEEKELNGKTLGGM